MRRSLPWVVASAFLAAAVFLPSDQDVEAGQAKASKAKFKAPTRTQPRIFRVQARAPYWRAVTIAPNIVIAKRIKYNLVRNGWQVQMRQNSVGQVAIRARVIHWHTRAVVPYKPQAQRLAYILASQGLQARIR